ncbi:MULTISPECIES: LuxR family transcriptional regulator [unclassified Streptomyces]|uniref:helix-turn-helix transcriptional regulator n=1 Tax=unclassified Streptomyces TaxID=2593676 RepID=UPI00224E4700|nr:MULTISPECIES: LuxR family transcriptional regulator [unclassified Streptomyces]MCX4991572.1 LuxR C-terminal-related transcriptional regulator [Streptomyces sp. NBC_00568]MCX5003192.1 LuxR C-terminal-related transcriptional regulator [Streptomyces sp. NBC_00638]
MASPGTRPGASPGTERGSARESSGLQSSGSAGLFAVEAVELVGPAASAALDGVECPDALREALAGLLLVVEAERAWDMRAAGVDAAVVLGAAGAGAAEALDAAEAAGVLRLTGGRVRVLDPGPAHTVYATVPPARRRAAHRLLAAAHTGGPQALPVLFHRASAATAPAPRLGDALAAAAALPGGGPTHAERSAAWARSAELAVDEGLRAVRLIHAADQARLAGLPHRARELLAQAGCEGPHDAVRGSAQLVSGQLALQDGPVADAREALLLAAESLASTDPHRALAARLAAVEASWAMGDAAACREALDLTPARPEPDRRLAAYRAGMSAVMHGRLDTGRQPLREVVAGAGAAGILDSPEVLLRAGGAALVVGDLPAACRANSRALAVARARGPNILIAQALERLAYGELRAGRHARARAHAEDGLRTALGAGQDNLAAHHHAILALVASVEGSSEAVAEHAAAAERVAAPHGLAQAATLAQWARARADLAGGRLAEAAARLGPLVGAGPRRGHFAVRMLAVPCFVEAATGTGQAEAARSATAEFAHWAAQGADPQAPAQLARCRALLSGPEEREALFTTALARHDEVTGDFERGRTQLLYGAWLRRRRRPGEARGRLRDALVSFERGGALGWAAQARAELRATGDAGPCEPDGPLAVLTPQQLRIARCVAEGATNREVALRLSVSPRTVDHHLRNVFAALGVRSRVELSRWVDRAEKTTAHP